MPEDLPQPHDSLFRTVFGEPAEAGAADLRGSFNGRCRGRKETS